jgi:hypothetical protein
MNTSRISGVVDVSEPEGFLVRLGSLEDFAGTVADVRADYAMLSEQLAAADLATKNPAFDGLLGLSRLPGSTAANKACGDALAAYRDLYSRVNWAQAVLKAQLDAIATNITDTHQLYRDVEATQQNVFRGMLDAFPSGAERAAGGDDGSAGQG